MLKPYVRKTSTHKSQLQVMHVKTECKKGIISKHRPDVLWNNLCIFNIYGLWNLRTHSCLDTNSFYITVESYHFTDSQLYRNMLGNNSYGLLFQFIERKKSVWAFLKWGPCCPGWPQNYYAAKDGPDLMITPLHLSGVGILHMHCHRAICKNLFFL